MMTVFERVRFKLNQVGQSVTDIRSEPVVSHGDFLLIQIDAEHGLRRDDDFAQLLLSQHGHPTGPQQGVLVPHQLHFGEIWWEEGQGYFDLCNIYVATDSNFGVPRWKR